jgi:hypothetical protein
LIETEFAARLFSLHPARHSGGTHNAGRLSDPGKPRARALRRSRVKVTAQRHAAKVRHNVVNPDPGYNPDGIGVYLHPYLHLYGTRDSSDWKADLSIIEFAK